ncbi:hypothetical protein LCGC14_0034990 [marine sediment metagenome]|uniref:PBP domain-containing protein n=1 Tax=marine sediment metagenome TaxID=412755 RepID=A0A0F9VVR8_9ZZZZ
MRHQLIHATVVVNDPCMALERGVLSTSEQIYSMRPFVFTVYLGRQIALLTIMIILVIGLSLTCTTAYAGEQPVLLVANSDVTTRRLNRDTARAIIAMRQRTWPDGQAVRVFVLDNNHPVHARFAKEQLSVYPHQLQLAWDRMVFSGTGQAPDRVNNQLEMRERVANTPGALGYLEREYLDDSIQVISMD